MNEDIVIKQNQYLYTAVQEGNEPTTLTPLQEWLSGYVPQIEFLLWTIWLFTFIVVLKKLLQIGRAHV